MNLDDFIVQEEQLCNTPSREDGCPQDLEEDLRIAGCDQIETAGKLLELSQVVISTARVIFHRFFCGRSFIKIPIMDVVMACVFLAAKLEDDPCLTEDVAYVYYYLMKQRKKPSRSYYTRKEFDEIEDSIHHYEYHILTDLGFCVYVRKPHEILNDFLDELKLKNQKKINEIACNYLNKCFRTTLAIRFSPETIVCGSILLAARSLKINLSQESLWWTQFDVELKDIEVVYEEVVKLDQKTIPSLDDLEDCLNEIKKEYSKNLTKKLAMVNTTSNAYTCSAKTTFDDTSESSSTWADISSEPSLKTSLEHIMNPNLENNISTALQQDESKVDCEKSSDASSNNLASNECLPDRSSANAGVDIFDVVTPQECIPTQLGRRKRTLSPAEEEYYDEPPPAKRRRMEPLQAIHHVCEKRIGSILGKRKRDNNLWTSPPQPLPKRRKENFILNVLTTETNEIYL